MHQVAEVLVKSALPGRLDIGHVIIATETPWSSAKLPAMTDDPQEASGKIQTDNCGFTCL